MVDDCSLGQSLNDEVLVHSLVIWNSNLDYALLNQKHLLCFVISLTKVGTFLISLSFHGENELLFGLHLEISEVANLVKLKLEESEDLVIVLVHLLLKKQAHALEGLQHVLIG